MINSPIVSEEYVHLINGVAGRMFARAVGGKNYKPETFTSQKWSASRQYQEGGDELRMTVTMRFDDECRNGHNTFSITCSIDRYHRREWQEWGGGAAHEEIAKVFPELAPLIKWHLVSTDAPMHYIANTVYHASNRDHWGKVAGEPTSWDNVVYFADSPVSHKLSGKFAEFIKSRMLQDDLDYCHYSDPAGGSFTVTAVAHRNNGKPGEYQFGPKYTLTGFADEWHKCPFENEKTANEWADALNTVRCSFQKIPTAFSEGKTRDFASARLAANWPEATDEQLSLPKEELTELLKARLPAMVADFRNDMESAGFQWKPLPTEAE